MVRTVDEVNAKTQAEKDEPNFLLKKVLYITYDGLTDPLGQSQILPYLTELSKNGYSFTILSFEKKDRFSKNEETIRRLIEPYPIQWVPLFFTSKPPVLAKLYDMWQMKRAAFRLYKKEKFSLVHCRSYLAAQIGMKLKDKFGLPFLFDMRGFWADEKKEGGRWAKMSVLYNYYKRLEKKLLTRADAVVSLTHAAENEMLRWPIGVNLKSKIEVIPCCADFTHFSPEHIDYQRKKELTEAIGLNTSFPVISYLGSIGAAYCIKEMLQFFNLLKERFPSAKFLFFTKDDKSSVLNQLSAYKNIKEEDLYFAFVERKQLPTYLSLAHYSVFFYYPAYSRLACSPTKFAELAAMGIPVICNSVGDLNKEFLKGTGHMVLDDLSETSMKKTVDNLAGNHRADKEYIRNFSLKNYSLDKGVESYQKIYKQIIS